MEQQSPSSVRNIHRLRSFLTTNGINEDINDITQISTCHQLHSTIQFSQKHLKESLVFCTNAPPKSLTPLHCLARCGGGEDGEDDLLGGRLASQWAEHHCPRHFPLCGEICILSTSICYLTNLFGNQESQIEVATNVRRTLNPIMVWRSTLGKPLKGQLNSVLSTPIIIIMQW